MARIRGFGQIRQKIFPILLLTNRPPSAVTPVKRKPIAHFTSNPDPDDPRRNPPRIMSRKTEPL